MAFSHTTATVATTGDFWREVTGGGTGLRRMRLSSGDNLEGRLSERRRKRLASGESAEEKSMKFCLGRREGMETDCPSNYARE